jgi:CBS domain-containing protein
MSMRLKKQAVQITRDNSQPDNYVDISHLTKIERVTLKEIFKVIDNFQTKIRLEFTNSLSG